MSIFPHPHKEVYEAVKALLEDRVSSSSNHEDAMYWRQFAMAVDAAMRRDEEGMRRLLAEIADVRTDDRGGA